MFFKKQQIIKFYEILKSLSNPFLKINHKSHHFKLKETNKTTPFVQVRVIARHDEGVVSALDATV